MDVSREDGASASQVERTHDMATLTYGIVGPLHSYTQEGWVDNNNISTVMSSTFPSSQTEMLFTFRPSLINTELPCLLCGRSATSAIPGILGLAWSLDFLETETMAMFLLAHY